MFSVTSLHYVAFTCDSHALRCLMKTAQLLLRMIHWWQLANQRATSTSYSLHCQRLPVLLIHTASSPDKLQPGEPRWKHTVLSRVLSRLVDGWLTVPLLESVMADGGRWEHGGVWRQSGGCTSRRGRQGFQVTRHVCWDCVGRGHCDWTLFSYEWTTSR